MFAIELVEPAAPPAGTTRGRITVGDFTEEFEAALGYWSVGDYRASWRAALTVLLAAENATSCLVSSITDPESSNFVFCWPLYRDGDDVFVQSSLIFLADLPVTFDPARPWLSVEPRATVDEDGNRISEWRTGLSDVRAFLRR